MRSKMILSLLCLSGIILAGFQLLSPSAAFSLTATVNIEPNTLNVNMNGRWITAIIRLPEGYNVSDIDLSTVVLQGLFRPERSSIERETLMLKFDSQMVTSYLLEQLYHMGDKRTPIELTIRGQLTNGQDFEGSDTITALIPRG